ncbi:hypothetical protein SLEP1_g30678 [Rubroshorea leprosula]|uniref:Uncharacterized protein n=1 Tax=Rubroshorea leprosula TaxID=152421 RepID=A0AAV5K929_9ROSI|nr:hypothetical protein SLEP1_g30678 [Rubroshorea leprosula]
MLDSIVEQQLHSLHDFFDSNKFMLLEVDIFSLLKALAHSGNWKRALLFFEWVVLNLKSSNVKIDNQVVELMVRILGRESQHSIASKLLDVIPLEDYSLDVRAYTTILHVYSRTSKYKRVISVFERMKETGLSPTLVTYNVMLDVYGKIEGLLNEAKGFFAKLKSQGYVPGTVTYNAMLQLFGKAGIYSEALSVLKEMEDNNCPADSVTYNELVAAYVRAGFYKEGAALIGTMMHKRVMPNAVTYTTAMGISEILCIIGWLAESLSKNILWLDLGRFLVGCGIGLLSYMVPVYVAEITSKDVRGLFTSLHQICILHCEFRHHFLNDLTYGVMPCLLHLIGLAFIPESPRWLAKTSRMEEFEATLQQLRGRHADISQEAEDIKEYTEYLQSISNDGIRNLFQQKYVYSVIIFSINIKVSAGSLVTLVSWFGSWVTAYTFTFLFEWSSAGTFFIFAGICAAGTFFIAKLVPETKGRALEEIQNSMTSQEYLN